MDISDYFSQIEELLRKFASRYWIYLARFGMFVIFFLFGILKVLDLSPADELVLALHEKTINFVPFDAFYVFLGSFEMLIGILFLVPNRRVNTIGLALLLPQMFTTFLPLLFLPEITWHDFLVPSLVGQYIIKNLVLVSTGMSIVAKSK